MGLVLLGLTLLLGGCEAGSPTTGHPVGPDDGTTGTSGGGNAATLILGTWEATVILSLSDNDFLTTRTTLVFRADAGCRQLVESRQFSEGVTRTTIRDCTYRLNQGVVIVLYDGALQELTYPFSFPLNNRNVLVLSGLEYGRVA